MVGLGELEAEQVEQAAGHVELARHPQIQQVIADEVAREAQRAVHRVGGDQQQAVDHAIEEQMTVPRDIITRPVRWISWMPRAK